MHVESAPVSNDKNGPWYKELTRYHWFVLVVAALGWLFDTMDQQLFNLARGPAISELLGPEYVRFYGGLATMIFILGWATGGIIFGILGDRIGRAKTMMLTILVYSLFTGLSSLSIGFWDFALYRFLTGLGVGGEFAVGVALVAEVMPERARPHALGWLQALSAVGNISAAFISMALSPLEAAGLLGEVNPWRYMFVIGALPALLALLIRRRLKEPERWLALRSGQVTGQQLGSIRELFGTPVLRRNAIVGLVLATAGVVGLWGIGFFGFDLVRSIFRSEFTHDARQSEPLKGFSSTDEEERHFIRLLLLHPEQEDRFEDMKNKDEPAKPRLDLVFANPARFDLLDKPSLQVFKAAQALYQARAAALQATESLGTRNRKSYQKMIRDLYVINAHTVLEKIRRDEEDRLEEKKNSPPKEESKEKEQTPQEKVDALRATFFAQTPPASESLAPVAGSIMDRSKRIAGRLTWWVAIYGLLFNIGAFFGIYSFSRVTHVMGRKPAFAISFVMALLSTALAFGFLSELWHMFWMVPIMGFFQIALFGGYAIYFPELFPTRLRSTGTSFCYNVGRFLAAPGPLLLGTLASIVFGHHGEVLSWRYAGVTMCAFFLIGLIALPFAPETKGKPLPE